MSRIPSIRLVPPNDQVLQNLGLLQDLAGTWKGTGFNLIARPDHEGNANLYLQLNQTRETLEFDPISSAIPNRGFLQDDIQLFGLTYLQQITDATTGGALHIEPGIWVTVPQTTAPAEPQSIARMATIPHGNSMLAQGTASEIVPGVTNLLSPAVTPFTSFNSAPFGAGGGVQPPLTKSGFAEYDLNTPSSATNPRTPFGDLPAVPLPDDIDGVLMQDVINDPIRLLEKKLTDLAATGHSIEHMVVLNIATQPTVNFATVAGAPPTGVFAPVTVPLGGGGIANVPFLESNADVATVYATFWIEKVTHPVFPPFMQLQYAQMVFLNFPVLLAPPPPVTTPPTAPAVLTWPHVSVATLRKSFG
jgi:hypothetical protein